MDITEVNPVYATVKDSVMMKLNKLEKHFKADVIFFYGEIAPNTFSVYRSLIEQLNKNQSDTKDKRLVIFLNTPGGTVETVEQYVEVNRHYYNEVDFVVPDRAMSAGTVFCMSGDKIFMDYSSSLGPIDPQIFNGERYVPAMGYLDKINEYIKKAQQGILLNAVDIFFLQKQDIAFLRLCEQQRDLTVSLIKEWLESYRGVTSVEAEAIAKKLGDNSKWLSHGRSIDIKKLTAMGLKIDDYSTDKKLIKLIREYNGLLTTFIQQNNLPFFLNSRLYF